MTVVDIDRLDLRGPSGAVWALPAGGDLNANVVVVRAGDALPAHINHDVDVLLVVLTGRGAARIDGEVHQLGPNTVVLVPKRVTREVWAAPEVNLLYVTVHRARGGITIGAGR